VILVDDNSSDGTGDVARSLAGAGRLQVLAGAPLPAGWTGKLWAQSQGVARAGDAVDGPPKYLYLTDADIAHAPDTLRRLVARAEKDNLTLTSLMAKLTVETWPERLTIPAFIFFFDMLYPFGWVNDPRRTVAAAAGGVMLVHRSALIAAGGLEAIRGKIIDDCSLGALMKRQGPIWLGLTERAVSLRPYRSLGEIGRMVSRSAYAQLNFSPLLLAGTIAGMAIVYLAAPILALFADGPSRWLGAASWSAMAIAFQPMLRFYRRNPLWGLALPAIGALYTLFTLQSAVETWRGKGGMWKGRAQAITRGATRRNRREGLERRR
jgi:hopene-associated glycosyltransferase HpnB